MLKKITDPMIGAYAERLQLSSSEQATRSKATIDSISAGYRLAIDMLSDCSKQNVTSWHLTHHYVGNLLSYITEINNREGNNSPGKYEWQKISGIFNAICENLMLERCESPQVISFLRSAEHDDVADDWSTYSDTIISFLAEQKETFGCLVRASGIDPSIDEDPKNIMATGVKNWRSTYYQLGYLHDYIQDIISRGKGATPRFYEWKKIRSYFRSLYTHLVLDGYEMETVAFLKDGNFSDLAVTWPQNIERITLLLTEQMNTYKSMAGVSDHDEDADQRPINSLLLDGDIQANLPSIVKMAQEIGPRNDHETSDNEVHPDLDEQNPLGKYTRNEGIGKEACLTRNTIEHISQDAGEKLLICLDQVPDIAKGHELLGTKITKIHSLIQDVYFGLQDSSPTFLQAEKEQLGDILSHLNTLISRSSILDVIRFKSVMRKIKKLNKKMNHFRAFRLSLRR